MPDLSSRSASFCSSATCVSGWIILAWSTTRPVSEGKLMAKAVAIVHSSAASAEGRHNRLPSRAEKILAALMSMPSRRGALEFNLRRLGCILSCRELRHRLVGTEERRGPQYAGERLELGIVGPNRFDVVAPRDRDAIFGTFELGLEREEVLV